MRLAHLDEGINRKFSATDRINLRVVRRAQQNQVLVVVQLCGRELRVVPRSAGSVRADVGLLADGIRPHLTGRGINRLFGQRLHTGRKGALIVCARPQHLDGGGSDIHAERTSVRLGVGLLEECFTCGFGTCKLLSGTGGDRLC